MSGLAYWQATLAWFLSAEGLMTVKGLSKVYPRKWPASFQEEANQAILMWNSGLKDR